MCVCHYVSLDGTFVVLFSVCVVGGRVSHEAQAYLKITL